MSKDKVQDSASTSLSIDISHVTDDEIRNVVWRGQWRHDLLDKLSAVSAPLGTIQLGALVTHSYLATGRLDLLLGGACLTALGAGILDISLGKNYLSRAFNKLAGMVSHRIPRLSQPWLIATSGAGACAFLGGGELYHYLQGQTTTLQELLTQSQSWTAFKESASYPKIYANFMPFALATAAGVPKINQFLSARFGMNQVIFAQNLLSSFGNVLIAQFAAKAGLPLFVVSATGAAAAGMGSAVAQQIKHFALSSFDPFAGKKPAEEAVFMARLVASGKYEDFRQEWMRMLEARGHLSDPAVRNALAHKTEISRGPTS